METKRTWLYCYTANDNAESAEILAEQKRGLEAYAKEHDLEIVGSSSDTGDRVVLLRPGLLRFLSEVDDEAVDILLIPDLSCLADKARWYWNLLHGRGVHIHTISGGEILEIDGPPHGEM